MKTPKGRSVLVDSIRPGFFHFRCQGLELVVHLQTDGKAYLHYSNQNSELAPIFNNWRDAEKAVLDLFDQVKTIQQDSKNKKSK